MLKITIEGEQGEGKSKAATVVARALVRAGYTVKSGALAAGHFVIDAETHQQQLPSVEIFEQQR